MGILWFPLTPRVALSCPDQPLYISMGDLAAVIRTVPKCTRSAVPYVLYRTMRGPTVQYMRNVQNKTMYTTAVQYKKCRML